MKFLKNLFLFFLLMAIIAGSFWVSFLVGKRILVPTKKVPTKSFVVEKEDAKSPFADEISIEVETTAKEVNELASKYLKDEEAFKPEIEEKPPLNTPAVKQPAAKPVGQTQTMENDKYYVQVGAFSKNDNAERMKRELEGKGYSALIKKIGNYWRVYVGGFATKSAAQEELSKLKASGYEGFVRR